MVEYHYMCWPVCMRVMLTVPSPVDPLCLQSLFHVTDVFLPPDYVTNLQKVTDPTLTCAVATALSMLTLLPSLSLPLPTSQCAIPQYPVPLAPLRGSLPPNHSAHPPNHTPGGQGKRAGKRPKSAKVEQDQPLPSSQDESPLNR